MAVNLSSNLTSMLQDRLNFGEISSKNSNMLNPGATTEPSSSGPSFADTLKATLTDANQSIKAADGAAKDFSVGKAENLHDVMIAMEKADVALRTLTAVRGKMLEAYQEIMRMPV